MGRSVCPLWLSEAKPCSALRQPTFSQLGHLHLVVVSHMNTHFILSVGSISREPNSSPRPHLHCRKKEPDMFYSEPGNKRRPMGLGTTWRTLTVSDSLLGNLPQALSPGSGQAWVPVTLAGCVTSGQILCLSETQFPHLANRGLDSTITQTPPSLACYEVSLSTL